MRILTTIIALALLPSISAAGSDAVTFESFYKESSVIGWTLAAVVAVGFAATVFFTGGTASPLVAGIGTWVGNAMGLSGAAATNAGLAALGGGAIASGGLGIVGGTTLLTAALSFTTDVVIDYSMSAGINQYRYAELAEQSRNMATLPLPVNKSGPYAYEFAMKELESVDPNQSLHTNTNQTTIQQAISIADGGHAEVLLSEMEKARLKSLTALLHFISNDYAAARRDAEISLGYANRQGKRAPLPAFIFATSALYDEAPNPALLTSTYLKHAVTAEQNRAFEPLLFSIYLDRLMLRIDQEGIGYGSLNDVFDVMSHPDLVDRKVVNFGILMNKYLLSLFTVQQKIVSLSTTSNATIRLSPRTTLRLQIALTDYAQLLKAGNRILQDSALTTLNDRDATAWRTLGNSFAKYEGDVARLNQLVADLKEEQREHREAQDAPTEDSTSALILSILVASLMLLVFWRRRRTRN